MKSCFILCAALTLGSATLHAETTKLELEGASAEVYKKASGDDLYLYIFTPEGHDPAKDQRPAVVFFFGGGWNGGSPTQFEQHSRYLASRGMIGVVADYRVKSRQQTGPRECVQDGKSAVRYLRTHAERLGIDPDRLAAGGGSAGGHVATATGMVDGLEEPGEATEVSSKPNALALFNPVYDNGPEDGWGHDRVKDYWQEISPAHNITKDDPPAIVFLGTEDPLIPVSIAEKFDANMKAAGLKSELHLYQDQSHGFFNESKGGTENFLDTLRKMDAFFAALGYLEGETTEEQLKAVSKGPAKAKTKAKAKN